MNIDNLKNKNIVVLGLGKEGIDNILFLKRIGCKNIAVADKNKDIPKEIKDLNILFHTGEDYLSHLKKYEVIVKSPGVPIKNIPLEKHQILTSQTDIFLNNCKGKVIGVTGTKGKSTLCFILYELLKKAGLSSYLIGNMGNPALSLLKNEKEDDIFIYEISSFQLETVTKSPHIAIILNIYKDHLDNHESFESYIKAKKKITDYQNKNDVLIFNSKDKNVVSIANTSLAKKIPFVPKTTRKDIATTLSPIYIIGKHLGINKKVIDQVINNFNPLCHRMEFVGEFNGIKFYNDSASTIPEASVKAIINIGDVDSLIAGGVNKGGDYSVLAKQIVKNGIRNLILFKESGIIIEKEIKKISGKQNIFYASSMKEAIDICFHLTKKGNSCLLSPASSSFNMFSNYKERGELFKKIIKQK